MASSAGIDLESLFAELEASNGSEAPGRPESMEVDLSVNGGQHIDFPQPVVVTIDYSRCNRWETLLARLNVWNIDQDTKALLQNMGGIDDKLAQSITFSTPHFSGFAIAY